MKVVKSTIQRKRYAFQWGEASELQAATKELKSKDQHAWHFRGFYHSDREFANALTALIILLTYMISAKKFRN